MQLQGFSQKYLLIYCNLEVEAGRQVDIDKLLVIAAFYGKGEEGGLDYSIMW